jgi:lambda family phage portal protein
MANPTANVRYRIKGTGLYVQPAKARVDYDAASERRRLSNWKPSSAGPNATALNNAETLRKRARDLTRNNPHISHAADTWSANLVGTGIKPQSQASDPAVRDAIQRLWDDWTDQADSQGTTDFYGMQGLAARSLLDAGEVFARIRPRFAEDGLAVPLQVQMIEADHCPVTLSRQTTGGKIVGGVEFNLIGRRVAYHLYPEHPGDHAIMAQDGQTQRIDAGEVAHVHRVLRPGQVRGVPRLASVMLKVYELTELDEAMLKRADVAARFAGFIRQNGDNVPLDTEIDPASDAPMITLEPGTLHVLQPGEDIEFSTPPDFGATYQAMLTQQLRAIAAGIGITYEQMTGDLTNVNYSSIRAGLLEFRRMAEQVQHQVLVFQFCRPIWNAWLDRAVLSGALPIRAQDYLARRAEYARVKWVPQGWSWVDPEKEFKAVILAIRAGLMSRSEAVSMYGYDAQEIDREVAGDNARADGLGLVYDTDPRKTSMGGQAQQTTTTGDAPANP